MRGLEQPDTERALYWEYHAFGAMQAVRLGDWKGVRLGAREAPDGPIALFDLSEDPGETNDVSADNPAVIARIDSVMHSRTLAALPQWNFGDDYQARQ